MALIGGPMHRVDFGQMSLERASYFHGHAWQGLDIRRHGLERSVAESLALGLDFVLERVSLAPHVCDSLRNIAHLICKQFKSGPETQII